MENNALHLGETLKDLIKEHNPSRELLAEHMGITSAYLYKLYKEEKMKSVYFVLACQFMDVDPTKFISTKSGINSFLKKETKQAENSQKIIEAQGEALKMYRINKEQQEKIQLLEDELAQYKKRDTNAS